MKKLLIFLLAINLFASDINNNGFVANPSSISFQNNDSYQVNENYLSQISQISCGDGSDSTTILSKVDLKSGRFTCLKYLEGQAEPQEINFSIDTARVDGEQKALKAFIDSSLGSGIAYYNQLGSYVFPSSSAQYATNYISTLNLSSLYNDNQSFQAQTVNNENLTISLTSGQNSEKTLSNILLGIFTMNPEYLKTDAISDSGLLQVQDYALDNGTSSTARAESSFITKAIRMFVNEKNENVSVGVVSLTDFMDKKFWGYYIYFLVNMEQSFNYIIGTLLLFGSIFMLGKVGYSQLKSKIAKEQHSIKLGTIGLNGLLAISFFMIPVETTQITIPDKFIYSKQLANNENFSSEEFYQQSTLAKVTLRYFADLGSTWANTVSDYGLYSYLRFLESKQGFITSRQVTQNDEAIKKLYQDIFYLKKDFDFLNYVCKPAYASYLSTNKRFNSVSKEAFEELNNPFSLSSSAIGEALKIDRIAPEVCQKLENQVFTNSRKILSDYAYLNQQLKINKAILSNENTDSQKIGFNTFVDLIQFQQNSFGWINSVSVPLTYNLFFQNANPVFNEDVQAEKIKESNDYNIISAWSKNEPEKNEVKNSIDDSVLANILGHIQSKLVWFMIPGFDKIYTTMHGYLSNVAGLDPTAKQMDDNDSTLDGALTSVKYIVGGSVGGPLGMIAGAVLGAVTSFAGFVGKAASSALEYGILMYISLIVSIFLMTMLISSLFLIIIATVSIVRIVMFYLEAIILIVMSDVMIFFALVTGNKEYLDKFAGKSLIVLILTPITIVFASYLYIFLSEASTELYLMLVGLSFDTMAVANETIIANSDNSFVNGLNAMVSAISLKALGTVVIHFFSMILGVYLIFKLKDMLLNIIGINSDDSNISKLTETLQSKLTGDAVNIK